MIGLGSNRLSVCRRGGMSVTQAGRGGMEWLAGGRRPRWSSPYSAQATAALKAQFQTQWPTIRDYGFAHPALVPFINEDPMLVMSLIEGLGVRGLVTDGSAWLDTGWTATGGMTAKIGAKILNNRTYYFGSHNTSAQGGTNDYNRNQFYIPTVGTNTARYNVMGKTQNDVSNKIVWGEYNDIEVYAIGGNGMLKVNGTSTTFSYSGTLNPLNTVVLYYYYYAPSQVNSAGTGCSYIELWNKDGVKVREMYPFIRKINGVDTCGMIDVLSGTFYQNAGSGSFTISETPAS